MEKWEKEFDNSDELNYVQILNLVKSDLEKINGISLSTFEKLYKWKTRGRSYHKIIITKYEDIYNENVKIAFDLPDEKKIYILNGMPGVGIAVASTILHFLYPNKFPIIDVNTIKALRELGYYDSSLNIGKLRDSPEAFNKFRRILLEIQKTLGSSWSLRRIDKALFSFGRSL